jgi:predicted AlkP superfamily pyrophosphatase or phosphodiesterase
MGHEHGPSVAETRDAVTMLDRLMGQLWQRLQSLSYPVNLIIVSDHGMMEVPSNAGIPLAALGISESFVVSNQGSLVHIYGRPETSRDSIEVLEGRLDTLAKGDPRYSVLTEEDLSQRDYLRPSRIGDVVLETIAPYRFVDKEGQIPSPGGHGFDPAHPDMGGLFVAVGPAFKTNITLRAASSLEIYPLLAKIMGLPLLSPVDRTPDTLKEGLSYRD